MSLRRPRTHGEPSHKIGTRRRGSKKELVCAWDMFIYTHMRRNESPSDVRRWFWKTIEGLWPVARGSLTLRKGPCIRKHCSACASGKGHSSYALYGRHGGRRFSVYVPERMVPEVRKA